MHAKRTERKMRETYAHCSGRGVTVDAGGREREREVGLRCGGGEY